MIRVAIADDHQVFLEGLELILNDHSDEIEVVGTANDGEGVLQILADRLADVVILDISMPGMEKAQTLQLIRKKYKTVKPLILTMHRDIKHIQLMLQNGAKGYLLKNRSGKEVVTAIKKLSNGERFFSMEVHDTMMQFFMPDDHKSTSSANQDLTITITKTEEKVLELLAEDLSGKLIADKLSVSPKTIESHKHNLKRKLRVHSEKGLVRFAVENGYIKDNTQ